MRSIDFVLAYVERERQKGIDTRRIIIGGFGQVCAACLRAYVRACALRGSSVSLSVFVSVTISVSVSVLVPLSLFLSLSLFLLRLSFSSLSLSVNDAALLFHRFY